MSYVPTPCHPNQARCFVPQVYLRHFYLARDISSVTIRHLKRTRDPTKCSGPASPGAGTHCIQATPRRSLPSCTAMTRAEPRCRDRVCREDGGRPTTRYTAMRRDEVGRLRRALCPTFDRSRHTLPTFAGPLLPCVPALTCYVLLTAWEYSHRLVSSLVLLSYQCSGWLPLAHALPLPLSA
jgi:hypothetical protein